MRATVRVNRIAPAGRQQDYQTYQVLAPVESHFRRATCEEVDCPSVRPATCEQAECLAYANGWRSIVPVGSDLADIVRRSGRRFLEKPAAAGLVEFVFPAGQQCFAKHEAIGGPCQQQGKHRVSLERPGIFVVRRGHRHDVKPPEGPFTGHRFNRPELWAEHFAEHQQKLADQRNRG